MTDETTTDAPVVVDNIDEARSVIARLDASLRAPATAVATPVVTR